ncbi:T9SS type A sorting domain-containing protein [Arundinibacter roseus]|uniref:T9SS type A sorting domain-containing protein n=1 Tax=Arundinibacter roseus TaxID=2070510 RepID=A0A4R4KDS1_9BACT|nr:T9SS type A sorting domain-containing protein [Arundinibacter roseus]TDB65793.1 T9SS type A sorting domain-containing protein [Arundinibacter roseus]
MKKVLLNFCSLALFLSLTLQVYAIDPAISALSVAPNPIQQYDVGTIVANFNVGGSGSIPIGSVGVQISFPNSYLPDPQSIAAVRATGAGSFFNWIYDSGARTLTGISNQVFVDGDGGLITIDLRGYVVTDPSFDNSVANLIYPNGALIGNEVGNDNLLAGGRVVVNPSPVSLLSFTAQKEAQTAVLSWGTAEEINSDRFEIEHSLTGKQWQKIGAVAAQGNSRQTNWYSFVDDNPANGTNLYRLRMIDKDGSNEVTRARSLDFEILVETTLYPNPVVEKLLIKADDLSKIRRVELYNATGRTVFVSETISAQGIDVKNLPNGFYVVRVTRTNGSSDSFKVLKQ